MNAGIFLKPCSQKQILNENVGSLVPKLTRIPGFMLELNRAKRCVRKWAVCQVLAVSEVILTMNQIIALVKSFPDVQKTQIKPPGGTVSRGWK